MNFINKYAQTIVTFFSIKLVLTNGAIAWDVCFVDNHQLIYQLS
jgi:hypothetical protein